MDEFITGWMDVNVYALIYVCIQGHYDYMPPYISHIYKRFNRILIFVSRRMFMMLCRRVCNANPTRAVYRAYRQVGIPSSQTQMCAVHLWRLRW